MGNYYGCGAFGLNIHENLYYLRLQQKPSLGAMPPVVRTEPYIPGLQYTNELGSAERGSGDNAYIYGAPYTYQRYLRGTIPIGSGLFTIKGSIPDPPLFAAQQLVGALEQVGIICQRPPARLSALPKRNNQLPERQQLHVHESPRLADIVERTNMKSVNLYAEALLRLIAYEQTGKGSVEAGLEIIYDLWTRRGVDMGGVQLYDGSGMAPRNVFPPAFMSQLLSNIYQDKSLREVFLSSLPLAGRSGSLSNSLKGTAAEGKLRAKSGSLEQVRAYSGYVPNRSGSMLAFSILLNNYEDDGGPARKKLFQLMAQLAQSEN
jgi:D-alanyl-D-alanine carboxypeptidase/D-alanyl-D-alanine-endopeptidase (penicillin-binding protein 4)